MKTNSFLSANIHHTGIWNKVHKKCAVLRKARWMDMYFWWLLHFHVGLNFKISLFYRHKTDFILKRLKTKFRQSCTLNHFRSVPLRDVKVETRSRSRTGKCSLRQQIGIQPEAMPRFSYLSLRFIPIFVRHSHPLVLNAVLQNFGPLLVRSWKQGLTHKSSIKLKGVQEKSYEPGSPFFQAFLENTGS